MSWQNKAAEHYKIKNSKLRKKINSIDKDMQHHFRIHNHRQTIRIDLNAVCTAVFQVIHDVVYPLASKERTNRGWNRRSRQRTLTACIEEKEKQRYFLKTMQLGVFSFHIFVLINCLINTQPYLQNKHRKALLLKCMNKNVHTNVKKKLLGSKHEYHFHKSSSLI